MTAGAAAIGTSPSHGAAAKSDPDNDDDTDTTSSEGEDPEITAYGIFLPFSFLPTHKFGTDVRLGFPSTAKV